MVRVGVDMGGTKIEAVVLDRALREGEPPRELARRRVPTERERGYDHVLETAARVVLDVLGEAGVKLGDARVGVGMPGSITMRRPDGSRSDVPLVKNSNTTCLNGRPFRQDLVGRLGCDVAFANDANCFALAEATWGAAREARVAFGVILGTGVGGGLVFRDGEHRVAWEGAQGIAGEWGHVTLEPEGGPPCYCGRRGCVEQYLAGPAIERTYAERTGESRKLAEIAASDDPRAAALLRERVELFGRAIATVINVVDPDVVVLGGGVSNLDAFYTDGAAAVGRWIFNDAVETRLVKHALGDSAGVLGAALLPRS